MLQWPGDFPEGEYYFDKVGKPTFVAIYFLNISYICNMATLNIEILNPKAKKLLQDLADLKLISISENTPNSFYNVVKKLRSKKARISFDEITKEVENVRAKRYGK